MKIHPKKIRMKVKQYWIIRRNSRNPPGECILNTHKNLAVPIRVTIFTGSFENFRQFGIYCFQEEKKPE